MEVVLIAKWIFVAFYFLLEVGLTAYGNFSAFYLYTPTQMFLFSGLVFGVSFYFLNFLPAMIVCLIVHYLVNYMGNNPTLKKLTSQKDKTYIITGVAENGIGYYLTQNILELHGNVVLGCRNVEKTKLLIEKFKKETKNENISVIPLDVSSMASIKNFVKEFKRQHNQLDVLINNAGGGSKKGERSADGFELTTAINYIGIYCLTMELLDMIKESKGRIVNTTSIAHYFAKKLDLDGWKGAVIDGDGNYARSKLYLNMFTCELQERLNQEKSEATVYSFHPGGVYTEIWGKNFPTIEKVLGFFIKQRMMTPKQGSICGVYLSANEEVKKDKGKYFFNNKVFKENKLVRDEKARKDLWEESEKVYKQFF
jgi:NAD(P)-dependent dehydrogenase (short-subunit alcohol dehydrogenase family)